MGSVKLISEAKKGKDDDKLRVVVTFKDNETKEYVCDFMGQSSEYSPLMVLLNDEKDDVTPVAMINSNAIKHIDIEVMENGGDVGS